MKLKNLTPSEKHWVKIMLKRGKSMEYAEGEVKYNRRMSKKLRKSTMKRFPTLKFED